MEPSPLPNLERLLPSAFGGNVYAAQTRQQQT